MPAICHFILYHQKRHPREMEVEEIRDCLSRLGAAYFGLAFGPEATGSQRPVTRFDSLNCF